MNAPSLHPLIHALLAPNEDPLSCEWNANFRGGGRLQTFPGGAWGCREGLVYGVHVRVGGGFHDAGGRPLPFFWERAKLNLYPAVVPSSFLVRLPPPLPTRVCQRWNPKP